MNNRFPLWVRGILVLLISSASLHAEDAEPETDESAAALIDNEPEIRPLDLQSIMHRLANEMPQRLDTQLPENYGHSKREVILMQIRSKAFSQLNTGQILEAIASFTEALNMEPDDKSTQFGLATAYTQNEEYAQAEKIFVRMIERYPVDYFIKNNLAWMLATAKDVKIRNGLRAVQLAQEALMVAPGDYHVWSTLAEAYYVSGSYKKGLRAAKEALYLAQQAKLSDKKQLVYQEQIDRNSRAALATSILE